MKATRTSARWVLAPHHERLAAQYFAFFHAAGLPTGRRERGDVASFRGLVGDPEDWSALPLADKLPLPEQVRPVVTRLCLMGKLVAPPDFLVARQAFIGAIAARHDPEFFTEFVAVAAKVANSAVWSSAHDWERGQWNHLVMLAAVEGVPARQITAAQLDARREKLWRAARAQGRTTFAERVAMCHFEVGATCSTWAAATPPPGGATCGLGRTSPAAGRRVPRRWPPRCRPTWRSARRFVVPRR